MSLYSPPLYDPDVHDRSSCTRAECRRCTPQVSSAPAIGQNPHDAAQDAAKPDPVIASVGLPKHPDPFTIAKALEDAAKTLRTSALKAIDMASILAAKGYSARTIGDGGSRGTDTTSSTERLASQPERWDAADYAYAKLLKTVWLDALAAKSNTDELLRHASDVDPTPAGQGECRACARFVKRTKDRPSHRLRSGLCPSCFGAWCNYQKAGGPMLWSEWMARRREGFTERNASGQIIAIHTPEPEESGQGA